MNHNNRQPAGQHIPNMLEQQRKQCDKRKIKRTKPAKHIPSTLELFAYLYIRLNFIAHSMYFRNAITLSAAPSRRNYYQGTLFFDTQKYLPDSLGDAQNPPVILSRYYIR
jgi:hypothetical protein